ncbi:uncharacterized protein DUF2634 [Fontibacillus phaseoli]|uniref:Uncharacterized protein DUF2634 n=1 Tax=Fontibacillus phaseoli TaxID=1416533 RepID=A0A369BPH3_9BACL|nr:DUF2634 domain-containing protein [Fontibacillus phaseoli]RCX22965.1 uncharacterized protein DUF2634 [Fontibacillus phaseoli]
MALSPLEPADITEELNAASEPEPLRTYALDFETGAMGGVVDGKAALKQFVIKAIKTARFRFAAYDDDYGCELDDLIGQNATQALMESEIPRVIEEALIYDDRIERVYGFGITKEADVLSVSFYVDTADDTLQMEVAM